MFFQYLSRYFSEFGIQIKKVGKNDMDIFLRYAPFHSAYNFSLVSKSTYIIALHFKI